MKRGTLILSAALTLAMGGGVWLFVENHRLRAELDTAGALALPRGKGGHAGGKPPSAAVSPSAAAQGPGPSQSPEADSRRKGPGQPLLPAAQGAPFNVVDNGDGTFTVSDAVGSWQQVMTAEQWRDFKRKVDSAMVAATTKLPGGPSWSPGRAAGPPDTANAGDYATAWASQAPDGGKEWLQLKYAKSVEINEINIHETYNPGALSKVSAIMPDGSEKVIWQGTEDPDDGVVERAVKVPKGIRSDQIRIELDTSRVPGWNEIDAVELVGTDGSHQWATESTASSYFGQGRNEDLSGLSSDGSLRLRSTNMVLDAEEVRLLVK